uniref:Uncharacterized protein n=1 Tax=Setaria italica TaxID=4555 RepID=K4AP97_SETIT
MRSATTTTRTSPTPRRQPPPRELGFLAAATSRTAWRTGASPTAASPPPWVTAASRRGWTGWGFLGMLLCLRSMRWTMRCYLC